MKAGRVQPPTCLLVSIAVMALLDSLAPVSEFARYPWNLLGVIPLLAGIVLNLSADAAFRRARTTVKPFETSTTLITDGVFRISRHPMYLGMVLILLGIAVLMGVVAPLPVVAAFAVLMDRVYARKEERMLSARFGPAWDAYRNRTRKWV